MPGGHRLGIHLTARTRGPGARAGAGVAAARRQRSQYVWAGLGWARPGSRSGPAAAPGPPARAGQRPRGLCGLRWAVGGGREVGRGSLSGGSVRYIYFSSLPPFSAPPRPSLFFSPSFCYLDFFSCCVMSIIYAKSFAACCIARASRRGRRAGRAVEEGRVSGELRTGGGGGEGTRGPQPRREAPEAPSWDRSGGSGGRVTQSPSRCRLRWFHFGRYEREPGSRDWGPMPPTFPSAEGGDSQPPPCSSLG